MEIPQSVENGVLRSLDFIYSLLPRSRPDLSSCKIIAHRGAHDNVFGEENTMEAFEHAQNLGLFGIEFDVRWTKDFIPVVFHDSNLKRIFKQDQALNEFSFLELREKFPRIPSLEEVVLKYGKKLHLMIEVKEKKRENLERILSHLTPIKHFHILSLNFDLYEGLDFLPSDCFLLIAQIETGPMVDKTIKCNYGGLLGHYHFLKGKDLKRLRENGKKIGTGFIASRFCLYREKTRGIDFLFTNSSSKLQDIVGR